MNKIVRFLIKLTFIVLVVISLIILGSFTGLRLVLLMLFFVFFSNTWKYGKLKMEVNGIDDYYSLFNLNHNFSKTELEQSYNLELEKLNKNFSISAENKISLIAFINSAYDTLNDPIYKNEYDLKYNSILDEIKKAEKEIELENKQFSSYFNGLLNYNLKPFKNYTFFSKNTIGILACLIIDLVFILPKLF